MRRILRGIGSCWRKERALKIVGIMKLEGLIIMDA